MIYISSNYCRGENQVLVCPLLNLNAPKLFIGEKKRKMRPTVWVHMIELMGRQPGRVSCLSICIFLHNFSYKFGFQIHHQPSGKASISPLHRISPLCAREEGGRLCKTHYGCSPTCSSKASHIAEVWKYRVMYISKIFQKIFKMKWLEWSVWTRADGSCSELLQSYLHWSMISFKMNCRPITLCLLAKGIKH